MPSEEVTFYSGGCAIAGTFTQATDPVAAALMITGGGRSDRNSDVRLPGGRILRIRADKAIAGALAGARVCALRYDKRGVGASGREYLRALPGQVFTFGCGLRECASGGGLTTG